MNTYDILKSIDSTCIKQAREYHKKDTIPVSVYPYAHGVFFARIYDILENLELTDKQRKYLQEYTK